MAYVNLPDSRLGISVASLIGTLIGIISLRIGKEINNIQSKLQISCGNINALSRLVKKVSSLNSSLISIKSRITKIQRIVTPLDVIIRIFSIALRILKLLPIPNATTTTGVTNTFSDIIHKVKEFIKQAKDDIAIIRNACNTAILLIDKILEQTSRIDLSLKSCLDNITSPDSNEAQNNLINSLGFNPEIINGSISTKDFRRLGKELFKDVKSLQEYNSSNEEQRRVFSENLGLIPKDTAKAAFVSNVDIGMLALEASQKTGLSNEESTELLTQINKISPENKNPSYSLSNLRVNLEDNTLYLQPTVGLSLVSKEEQVGLVLIEDTTRSTEEQFFYTGPDGTSYTITVISTDLSLIAPKRKAIAKDRDGVIRYSSDESFSSSTDVLIKEVQFNIDNNIF